MTILDTPFSDREEEDLELIGDTSIDEAGSTQSHLSPKSKLLKADNVMKNDLSGEDIHATSHEYFVDEFPSPLGKYFIDESGNKVYTSTSGFHFYFERNEDGVYPVTIVPTNFRRDVLRNIVNGPLGFSIGNGCFRRGSGGV